MALESLPSLCSNGGSAYPKAGPIHARCCGCVVSHTGELSVKADVDGQEQACIVPVCSSTRLALASPCVGCLFSSENEALWCVRRERALDECDVEKFCGANRARLKSHKCSKGKDAPARPATSVFEPGYRCSHRQPCVYPTEAHFYSSCCDYSRVRTQAGDRYGWAPF